MLFQLYNCLLQRQMQQTNQKVVIEDEEFQILPELTPEQALKLEQEHKQRLEHFYNETKQYTIEQWYEILQEHTFQSHSFPLTNIEAYLLNLIYQENTQKLQENVYQEVRLNLAEKVDSFLKKWFPQGCFFKLSTRSPKDYGWRYEDPLTNQLHQEHLYNKLSPLKLSFGKELINQIYRYFLQQSKAKIKITTGEQFIEVFSHSERIQIDINDLMYLNGKVASQLDKGEFSRANEKLMNVWGRKWVHFEWMEEFRCFYHRYQVTGICQYDQRCFFKEIVPKENQIKQTIMAFFEKIAPKLKKIGLQSGVMDVIVQWRSEQLSIHLIEINVFNSNTRASLYSWQTERTILEEGPVELRYHKQPKQISKWQLMKMMGMMERGIDSVVQPVMEKLGYLKQWEEMQ